MPSALARFGRASYMASLYPPPSSLQPWRTSPILSSAWGPMCTALPPFPSPQARFLAKISPPICGVWGKAQVAQIGEFGSFSFVDRLRPNQVQLKAGALKRSDLVLLFVGCYVMVDLVGKEDILLQRSWTTTKPGFSQGDGVHTGDKPPIPVYFGCGGVVSVGAMVDGLQVWLAWRQPRGYWAHACLLLRLEF